MRAVTINFESHAVELKQVPEPKPIRDGEVLFRVDQIGVCGTDRELAALRLVMPPPGDSFLTLGHEALGQVVETGPNASGIERGDWVVPFVRRPCAPACRPCAAGRSDLCATGDYVERGIVRMHGYFTDYAVDESRYLLPVPAGILDVAILIEPLSSVEKAIEVALCAHVEFFGFDPPRALVLGAGAIGILSALAFRERGFEVAVCSVEASGHPRVRLLETAGFRYIGTAETWPADIVLEATGAAEALVTGARSLGRNGVMITLGAPNKAIEFPFRDMIIRNQALVGSVNAASDSFQQGCRDLARFDRRLLRAMIHRTRFEDFGQTLTGRLGPYPKVVHMMK